MIRELDVFKVHGTTLSCSSLKYLLYFIPIVEFSPPPLLFNGLRESIVTTRLQGFILSKDYRFSNVLRPAGTVIMKIEAVPGIKVPGAMTYHVHIAL